MALRKAPDKTKDIQNVLDVASGEINRHLAGHEDCPYSGRQQGIRCPITPSFLHVVDSGNGCCAKLYRHGTAAQLRTQLSMVHEAIRKVADDPLGTVVLRISSMINNDPPCCRVASSCEKWLRGYPIWTTERRMVGSSPVCVHSSSYRRASHRRCGVRGSAYRCRYPRRPVASGSAGRQRFLETKASSDTGWVGRGGNIDARGRGVPSPDPGKCRVGRETDAVTISILLTMRRAWPVIARPSSARW